MEPGATLFRPIGGLASTSTNEQDREFLCSLWTVIPFPAAFLERVPANWRDEISRFALIRAADGQSATLSFGGDIFEVPEADWTLSEMFCGWIPMRGGLRMSF